MYGGRYWDRTNDHYDVNEIPTSVSLEFIDKMQRSGTVSSKNKQTTNDHYLPNSSQDLNAVLWRKCHKRPENSSPSKRRG